MPTLLLTLSGPLQAWGVTENGAYRDPGKAPSHSGVVGMVASALGRDRFASLDDLYGLDFAVRSDLAGTCVVDLHTVQEYAPYTVTVDYESLFNGFGPSRALKGKSGGAMMLRCGYLADAVFVAALSGDSDLLGRIAAAVRHPVFPLFLGRRNCPAEPLNPTILDADTPVEALRRYEYQGWSPVRAVFADEDGVTVRRLRDGGWGVPDRLAVYHAPDADNVGPVTWVSDRVHHRRGWHRSFYPRKQVVSYVPPVLPNDDPIGF